MKKKEKEAIFLEEFERRKKILIISVVRKHIAPGRVINSLQSERLNRRLSQNT